VVIAALALMMQAQADTWWHLAAGRDIAQSKHVALTDTWSHTVAGQRWPNYEWLSELIMFAAYRTGGLPLVTSCAAILVLLAQICSWRQGIGPIRWRAILLLATLPCATVAWSTRPQLFTYGLVPLWVSLLLGRRWMGMVIVAVLWTNLHGGAAYAVLLAGTAAAVAAVLNRDRLRQYLLATGVAVLAGLCTPLGLDYWPAIVQSVARSRTNGILEWQPPALTLALAPAVVGLVGIAVELLMRRTYGKDPLFGLLLTFGVAMVIEESIRLIWGTRDYVLPTPPAISGGFIALDLIWSAYRFYAAAIAALVIGLTWLLIEKTPYGSIMVDSGRKPRFRDPLRRNEHHDQHRVC